MPAELQLKQRTYGDRPEDPPSFHITLSGSVVSRYEMKHLIESLTKMRDLLPESIDPWTGP